MDRGYTGERTKRTLRLELSGPGSVTSLMEMLGKLSG
jgi:hypothetical protein